MSDQFTTVRIESGNHNASTPLMVNGQTLKRIRHNEDTGLTQVEFEVLKNSNVVFKLVDGAITAQSADGGAEEGHSASPETFEQAEREREAAEAERLNAERLAAEEAAAKEKAANNENKPGSTLNVDPFDAGKTLDQSIKKISEDLDEFTADQLTLLIAAENAKGDDKRTSLIGALEKKLAASTAPAAE